MSVVLAEVDDAVAERFDLALHGAAGLSGDDVGAAEMDEVAPIDDGMELV